MNDRTKAMTYILISAVAFSIMAAFVKTLPEIPVFEKVFFRNIVPFLVALYIILKKGRSDQVKLFGSLKNQKYLLSRALLGIVGVAFNFYGITRLYLADSQMLHRTSPFFVTLWAILFLKERIPKVQVFAMLVAFSGVLMVVKPNFDISILPGVAAVMAAACTGGAYTLLRFLRNLEKPETIVFYFSFVSQLVMLPLMLPSFVYPDFKQWILLIGTGAAAAVGQFGSTLAYRYAKASEVSIYTYTGIVFSGIIGFLYWNEIPDVLSLTGGIAIIMSACLVRFGGTTKGKWIFFPRLIRRVLFTSLLATVLAGTQEKKHEGEQPSEVNSNNSGVPDADINLDMDTTYLEAAYGQGTGYYDQAVSAAKSEFLKSH